MPLSTLYSPTWHLRFGQGGWPNTIDKRGAKEGSELFQGLVSNQWDWTDYEVALAERKRNLGEPRYFDAVQCVQPGASDPFVFEALPLTLHPTMGVPVIHGDAIKGVCRHAMGELMAGDEHLDDAMKALFGLESARGQSIFEDAWWVPTVKRKQPFFLEVEGHEDVDLLVGSTRPISRLAAAGRFAFWLAPVTEGEREWHDAAAWTALTATLKHFGVGSRRNVDAYGRMIEVPLPP